MKKILLIGLLLCFISNADAGQIDRFFDYGTLSEVNAINLNGNFNNIVNEANGGWDNTNTADNFNFVEVLSVLPVAGTEGRVVFLTTDDTLNFDDGSQWLTAPTVVGSGVTGDIIYFDGTNWVRLTKGTTGNTLSQTATIPSWAALNLAGGSAYVTGLLPMANAGTGANLTNDPGGIIYCGASVLTVLADGTAGKFLQSSGTSAPSWQKVDLAAGTDVTGTLAVGNGGTGNTSGNPSGTAGGDLTGTYPNPTLETAIPQNIQVFTTTGTWTRPAGIDIVHVKIWGGGGGGGSDDVADRCSGAGGGGGYTEGLVAVTGNVTVTVGGGGTAGTAAGGDGGTGGTSSFAGSTTPQATGGSGGARNGAGGAAGVGSTGTVNLTGGTGGDGEDQADIRGGVGGGSPMGGAGGSGGTATNGEGKIGTIPGGGGGGDSGDTGTGGTGAAGLVIVYY